MEKRRVTVHDATITKRDAIDSFLDKFAEKNDQDLVITSGHRGKDHKMYRKGSTHSTPGLARDIRTKDLSEAVVKKLILSAYKSGFNVIDERERINSKGVPVPHLHIDNRGTAGIMKWNNKLNDAQTITDEYLEKNIEKKLTTAIEKKKEQKSNRYEISRDEMVELRNKYKGKPYKEFENALRKYLKGE